MWRYFRRLISRINTIKQEMAPQRRYFPNKLQDYQAGQAGEFQPQDPQDYLPKYLVTIVEKIESQLKPLDKHGADGLYLGTAGISYMYYHLSKNRSISQENKAQFLAKAQEYLTPAMNALARSRQTEIPSFILGHCGVYAVAAVVHRAVGDNAEAENFKKLFNDAVDICRKRNFLHCGSDELFVGRAGYVLGSIWLARELKSEPPLNDLHALCKVMVESGRRYATNHKSPCPLMYSYYDVEYLGAAHGLCTIMQAFLSTPGYLASNPEDEKHVKSTLNYLLSLQDAEGNFPSATDEIGESRVHELVHWCHGAGGMIYLMAKAYLYYKEPQYLQSCEKMGELIWRKGLLKKGPGICHGVAGNGYAFLLLYRLTNNPKHLHRALMFAQFMQTDEFVQGARTPDHPYSLYEGLAGTACFIGDLMQPDQAEFPFSDVFSM